MISGNENFFSFDKVQKIKGEIYKACALHYLVLCNVRLIIKISNEGLELILINDVVRIPPILIKIYL
jgi:hypothetical protein